MTASSKGRLVSLANKLRNELGFQPNYDDIEASTIFIVSHIVIDAMNDANHQPIPKLRKPSDAIIGIILLCFIANPLSLYLEEEGITIPTNDIIEITALAIVQLYNIDVKTKLVSDGFEEYKGIIGAGSKLDNVRECVEQVNELVYTYLMSGDEKWIQAFSKVYMIIINAKEN